MATSNTAQLPVLVVLPPWIPQENQKEGLSLNINFTRINLLWPESKHIWLKSLEFGLRGVHKCIYETNDGIYIWSWALVYASITYGPAFMSTKSVFPLPEATHFVFERTSEFLHRFPIEMEQSKQGSLLKIAASFRCLIACLAPHRHWPVQIWVIYKTILIQASARLPVWPDIREQLHENSKIKFQQNLCTLANRLNMVIPTTYFSPNYPSYSNEFVRKENFSENAEGVTLWKDREGDEQPRWGSDSAFFVQQKISPLRCCGEYRILDLRDKARSWVTLSIPALQEIHDVEDQWRSSPLENTRSLEALKLTPEDSWNLDNHPGRTSVDIKALDDVRLFASQMLDRIHKMESARFSFPLSIKHLGRIDVGVMRGNDGNVHYFVNELARAPISCLWMPYDDNGFRSLCIGLKVDESMTEYCNFWKENPSNRPYRAYDIWPASN